MFKIEYDGENIKAKSVGTIVEIFPPLGRAIGALCLDIENKSGKLAGDLLSLVLMEAIEEIRKGNNA